MLLMAPGGNLPARLYRGVLESEPARVDRGLKQCLRESSFSPASREAFAAQGCRFHGDVRVVDSSSWKWRLVDDSATWVVRDAGDHLDVSRERFPVLSRLIRRAAEGADHVRHSCETRTFYAVATFRKQHLDRPNRVMINVGAGRWYAKGWKVMDYSGDWYRYDDRFIDHPLDLMKKQPFPFEDGSVDLFYSEHVFEHFPDDVGAFGFGEMRRCLKPGGGARIVVPDAELLYERFGARDLSFFSPWMNKYESSIAGAFTRLIGFREAPPDDAVVERDYRRMPKADFFRRYTEGLQYDYSNAGEHINWFTSEKLEAMLRDAGFRTVLLSEPQMSRFSEIRGPAFDTRPHYSVHVDAVA